MTTCRHGVEEGPLNACALCPCPESRVGRHSWQEGWCRFCGATSPTVEAPRKVAISAENLARWACGSVEHGVETADLRRAHCVAKRALASVGVELEDLPE